MSNRIDEYRANYKRMVDAQLLELAEEMDLLTDDARAALQAEMEQRGIAEETTAETQSQAASPNLPPEQPALPEWSMFGGEKAELPASEWVTAFVAGDESEAAFAQQLFQEAGIESQLQIVVLVRQADSEEASEIIAEQFESDEESDEEEEDEEAEEDNEDE